jgi:hypothetical protein
MSIIQKIADNSSNKSLAHSMRFKRFLYFKNLIDKLDKPVKILDIGGTQMYWVNMGLDDKDYQITLLNLSKYPTNSPNFTSTVGDASDLSQYPDKSFDVVFSNSVIEHLYTKVNQKKMASEAMRVGKYYFIQTPNYYFPLEPHFLFPGFQFFPKTIRAFLIKRFKLGHISRKQTSEEARRIVDEIRLLTVDEMKGLFPQSLIYKEKVGGLTKSVIAHNLHLQY